MSPRMGSGVLLAVVLSAALAAAGCGSTALPGTSAAPAEQVAAAPGAVHAGAAPETAVPPQSRGRAYTPNYAQPPGASAINQFGLDLLRATETTEQLAAAPNTVISPLSVHIALAMASDAAAGPTRAEMRRVLGVSPAQNGAYRATIASIWNGDKSELQLADSVWTTKGFAVRPTFAQLMHDHFNAEAKSTDFGSAAGPKAVNDWVASHTNGRIKQLMSSPDPSLMVLLLNTAHFLGSWETPFKIGSTAPATFHLDNGRTVKVPTMHVDGMFAQVRIRGCSVLELPYSSGRTSMLVFLPAQGFSVDSMLATMTVNTVRDAEVSLAAQETWNTTVSLPKVLQTWKADLVPALETMGVHRAFSPLQADLSAMSAGRPLWFASVTHMTYLDVNEKTTEAAAATGFAAHGGYGPPPRQFNVNHPYAMAIIDKPTGAILFLAVTRDPSK